MGSTTPSRTGTGSEIWASTCRSRGECCGTANPAEARETCSRSGCKPSDRQLLSLLPAAILYTWLHANTRCSVLAVIAAHFLGNLTGQLLLPSGDVRSVRLVLEVGAALAVLAYCGPTMLSRRGRAAGPERRHLYPRAAAPPDLAADLLRSACTPRLVAQRRRLSPPSGAACGAPATVRPADPRRPPPTPADGGWGRRTRTRNLPIPRIGARIKFLLPNSRSDDGALES
jgi:hypothetical protein